MTHGDDDAPFSERRREKEKEEKEVDQNDDKRIDDHDLSDPQGLHSDNDHFSTGSSDDRISSDDMVTSSHDPNENRQREVDTDIYSEIKINGDNQHSKKYENEEETSTEWKCPFCSESFSCRDTLMLHYDLIHQPFIPRVSIRHNDDVNDVVIIIMYALLSFSRSNETQDNSKVCLAEFCEMFRCDILMKEWKSSLLSSGSDGSLLSSSSIREWDLIKIQKDQLIGSYGLIPYLFHDAAHYQMKEQLVHDTHASSSSDDNSDADADSCIEEDILMLRMMLKNDMVTENSDSGSSDQMEVNQSNGDSIPTSDGPKCNSSKMNQLKVVCKSIIASCISGLIPVTLASDHDVRSGDHPVVDPEPLSQLDRNEISDELSKTICELLSCDINEYWRFLFFDVSRILYPMI